MKGIGVENGKYKFFVHKTGRVEVRRFEEPWVYDFSQGGKAIIALLADFETEREKLKTLATAAKEVLENVLEAQKERLRPDDEWIRDHLTKVLKDVGQGD